MKYFETVYAENLWKNEESVSGEGSTLKCSDMYLSFLKQFVTNNDIKNILDLGCGDFNLMKHFNYEDIKYVGVDLVNELIEKNNINYGTHNIKFLNHMIHNYEFEEKYDLIICKDVLQHWSIKNVISFLKLIKNYKYCLLINDFKNDKYKAPIGFKIFNADIIDGWYTTIDLSIEPYNVKGEYIFEWQACNTLKRCFLIKK